MKLKNFIKTRYIFLFLLGALFQFHRVVPPRKIFIPKGNYTQALGKKGFFDDNSEKKKVFLEKDILILKDSKDEQGYSKRMLNNLEDVFKFSRINYEIKDDLDINMNLDKYRGIVILKDNYLGFDIKLFQKIIDRVNSGATLYFFNGTVAENPFIKYSGISTIKGIDLGEKMITKREVFPGYGDLKKNTAYLTTEYLDVELEPEAKVIAVNKNNKPLFWEIKRGKGNIIYSNNTLTVNNYMQGFMKQIFSYGLDFFVSPTLNSKVIQIDDFPAPFTGTSENIIRDYGLPNDRFITEIWAPDMKRLAEKLHLKYTTFLIMDYTVESTIGEVDSKQIDLNVLTQMSRALLQNNYEIGVHGFNHNPLSMADGIDYLNFDIYKPWESVEAMAKSQTRFNEAVYEMVGEGFEMFSYVAPNNLLTREGKEALAITHPKLKSLCGVFEDQGIEKGLLAQKVGVDPDFPRFYSLPRFSAGYENSDETYLQILNGIAAYGYVSHFVHPDDILVSDTRSFTKSWKMMRASFAKLMGRINNDFPYLKPQVQLELAGEYYKIENIQIETKEKDDTVTIQTYQYRNSYYAEFRAKDREIESIEGASYEIIMKNPNTTLYLLKIEAPEVTIKLANKVI